MDTLSLLALRPNYTFIDKALSKMQAPPPGHSAADGINGPLNPFVITPPPSDGKEDEIPGYVSLKTSIIPLNLAHRANESYR